MSFKIKLLIKELEGAGWVLDRISGSHHVFTHVKAKRSVVVPVHKKDISPQFAKIILKQAQKALED